jgi:cytochrome c
MIRSLFASVALIAVVAACGQSDAPASPSATSAAPAATTGPETAGGAAASPVSADYAAAIAALPAPYNTADYDAGRRVFAQCRSCHTIGAGEANRVGPNLHGLFGREIGAVEGFAYSQPVQDANFVWDAAQLDHWLQNPREFLPGNRMLFSGVRDETQRKNLIGYLMVESAAN